MLKYQVCYKTSQQRSLNALDRYKIHKHTLSKISFVATLIPVALISVDLVNLHVSYTRRFVARLYSCLSVLPSVTLADEFTYSFHGKTVTGYRDYRFINFDEISFLCPIHTWEGFNSFIVLTCSFTKVTNAPFRRLSYFGSWCHCKECWCPDRPDQLKMKAMPIVFLEILVVFICIEQITV